MGERGGVRDGRGMRDPFPARVYCPIVFDLIQSELRAFEAHLERELRSNVAFITAIGEDLASAGGKRLRPTLAFLAGRLLDADAEASMRVALSVELLHAASLLHDDLIDDARTRRGHDAAFRRYGNVVSVMSGDYMLARVLGILATSGSPAFTTLMSETAARICEGEVLQFQMATLETWDLASYRQVIEGKTAVLIAAAVEGVAMLSGAPLPVRDALRTFGMSYGRAFQMQDDMLDLLGEPAELGKPVGGDLREGKATHPVLLLLEDGHVEAQAILRRHGSEEGDVERMRRLVRARGADARTREAIANEARAAIAALRMFPASPAREALETLAERELDRVR